VTDAVLVDTHIALWFDSGSERLRPSTRAFIDGHWRNGGTVFLSAVTVWEIALLVDTGRIELDCAVEEWIERFVDHPGIEPVPLGHRAACRAYTLHGLPHRDPADRLLFASAIELGCPLITYDERIVDLGKTHGRQFGFATAA
jgi:PIN domain nuclease of toxin-antitoxin system